MANKIAVAPEFIYTSVDLSGDTVDVYSGPTIVRAIIVSIVLSNHTVLIYDGDGAATKLIDTLPASLGLASRVEFHDMVFNDGIFFDPDNDSTGTVLVIHSPQPVGDATGGAGLP